MWLSTDWGLSHLLPGDLAWILWIAPTVAETDDTEPIQIYELAGIVQRVLELNLEIQAAKGS